MRFAGHPAGKFFFARDFPTNLDAAFFLVYTVFIKLNPIVVTRPRFGTEKGGSAP